MLPAEPHTELNRRFGFPPGISPRRRLERRRAVAGRSCRLGGFSPAAISQRNCILVLMTGGPSQLETFDPKPDAAADFRGTLGAIETSVPGSPERNAAASGAARQTVQPDSFAASHRGADSRNRPATLANRPAVVERSPIPRTSESCCPQAVE